MGKPKKTRKCKFNYNKDRRKSWKKSKKLPSIPCNPIKNAWDDRKSASQNLREMGLSSDPNKTLPINPKDLFGKSGQIRTQKSPASKSYVVEELEVEASQTYASTMRLSHPNVQFCVYMMNKYAEDYKAMAKDPKNHYQETPKQILRKINAFKNTPSQYAEYLATSKECVTPVSVHMTKECVIPYRRRVPTRWFEAAFRNGHVTSLSPVPPSCTQYKRGVDAVNAALVRVRRRLQFGRKPPKQRCSNSTHEERLKLSEETIWPAEEIAVPCASTPKRSLHIPAPQTRSPSVPGETDLPAARPWRGLARYRVSESRDRLTSRMLDVGKSGPIVTLEGQQAMRAT